MTALASQPASISRRQPTRAKFVLPEDADYEVPDSPDPGPHARIASIQRLMTKKVNSFLARMRPRERAQYDKVDILQELWVILMEKDHYYDPNRVPFIKYTTWSDYVIKQHLGEIKYRARLVQSPRDTQERLQAPETQTCEMLAVIRQAIAEVSSLNSDLYEQPARANEDELIERWLAASRLNRAIRQLPDSQIRVLTWKHGLRGQRQLSMQEIAAALGTTVSASHAGRLAQDAEKALLDILEADERPYTSECTEL